MTLFLAAIGLAVLWFLVVLGSAVLFTALFRDQSGPSE